VVRVTRSARAAPDDPPVLSGLGTRAARATLVLVWLTGVAQVAMAWSERSGWQLVAALLTTFVGALAVTAPGDERLPAGHTVVVAAVPVVNAVLVLPGLDSVDQGTWPLDIAAYLAGLLMVRGRVVAGWAGGGGLVLGLLWWILVHRPPLEDAFELLVQPVIALAIGTAWHLLLVRVVSRIVAHRAAESRAAVQEEVTREAIAHSQAELRAVAARATPLLQAIARGDGLSPAECVEAIEVEAELRDELRARRLVVPPLRDAVRAARRRGVEVLLLDDRGATGDPLYAGLVAELAGLVGSARTGSVTIRALPPGRRHVVTAVVDDGTVPVRRTFGG
jgi:hypothetical protein